MIVLTMSCQSQYVRMFDGVLLKCMLTWHTDYLENTNLALLFENVAYPWSTALRTNIWLAVDRLARQWQNILGDN